MTTATQTILKEALRLTPGERAELVEGLLHSFDVRPDASVDAAWAKEAESRIDAYESGQLSSDSAANVFSRIARR